MKLFRFIPNRVWRVYEGGASIDALRGEAAPRDGHSPEEWIASTVAAINPRRADPAEGISRVAMPDGGSIRFDELLARNGAEILGREHFAVYGPNPAFLTKLLDSAIRLPVQAHPDRDTARKLFCSDYGKTESWLILGGRRIAGVDPYLLIGFNETFDAAIFREEARTGIMTRTLAMMHRWPAVPGEVIMIPGGMPHAIGSGVFLQEIMEPTDWVYQPEKHCGDTELCAAERFNGTVPERALEVFHCRATPREELRRRLFHTPREIQRTTDAVWKCLLDRDTVGFFGALELQLHGSCRLPEELNCFMACTVLEGAVEARSGSATLTLAAGDTFGVAAGAYPEFQGSGKILFALPPVPGQQTGAVNSVHDN